MNERMVLFVLSLIVGAAMVAVPLTTSAQSYSSNTGLYTVSAQNFQNQQQVIYIQQLLELINRLTALLRNIDDEDFDDDFDDDDDIGGDSILEVTTNSASNIEDDRARINGEVDFNSSDFAYLWFEWGEDDDDLDEETPRIRRDDDESEDFAVTLTRLDEDQEYFFRAVGKDEDGRNDFGNTRSFTTDEDGDDDGDDDDDNGDEPDVETGDADDISDDSVSLEGEVDMNDFEDGVVFVVYGEDEDQIDDVEGEFDSFDDVDEDGDDLQKVQVDSGLDDNRSYTVDISGLNDDTEYFYAFCVAFEDDDNDDTLACGSTENFETDS